MYKLFGYGLKGIPYINRLKNRVFYVIVITIVALNIFISFSLNLKKISNETLINSFIIVDLQNNLDEEKRNEVIAKLGENDIATNVHFQPLPLLTAYKKLGFKIEDYPNAYNQYKNEISLPLHDFLTEDDIKYICELLVKCL